MEFVKNILAENPVVIFGKSYCPFCRKAIHYMSQAECNFVNIDLDQYLYPHFHNCLGDWMDLKSNKLCMN